MPNWNGDEPGESAVAKQALERRLERGRREEEARLARLAAQTNQAEHKSMHGDLFFVHVNCGQSFPSRMSLGQHTRWCKAPVPPPVTPESNVERVLEQSGLKAHAPVEGVIKDNRPDELVVYKPAETFVDELEVIDIAIDELEDKRIELLSDFGEEMAELAVKISDLKRTKEKLLLERKSQS